MVGLGGVPNPMGNMIESTRNWDLANDVELLKRLEKFAEDVINNASMTLSSMDDLEDNLNGTYLRVKTVANKFQAIADNQFIENRVQEEDFELEGDKTTELLESQLSHEASKAQLMESINECRNELSNKFETVQVSGIDFEDEMANSRPIVLVSKSVYKERKLPHLIGGERFIADETVGLMEHDEDLTEEPFERKEDTNPDETDRSSYYSGNYRMHDEKNEEINTQPVFPVYEKEPTPTSLPVHAQRSLFEEPSSGATNESEDLFRENKLSPLLDDNNVPTLSSSIGSQSLFGSFDKSNDPPKSESPIKKGEPIKTITPREQLLAGPNLASFKEDLARVLSRSQPFAANKQHSSDSDEPKTEFSSPSNDDFVSKEIEKNVQSPLKGSGSSEHSRFDQSTLLGRENSDILPNVTTSTLENLSKGRAKVKGKRRPPSRKHRQASVEDEQNGTNHDSGVILSPTQSEDTSIHESASTQPGSNILSPATDEEDLFVLPAFDLPSDPPSRGQFFGNTLLSPGAAIDDGGSASFPPIPFSAPTSTSESTTKPKPKNHSPRASTGQSQSCLTPPPLADPLNSDTSSDLFSSTALPSSKPTTTPPASQSHSGVDDLFTDKTITRTTPLSNDLFSSSNAVNVFSSSPPLFTDWTEPVSKGKSKLPLKSSLGWDLLGQDDISEDLFRASTSETAQPSKAEKPEQIKERKISENEGNIFSPTTFEKSSDPLFFEKDDPPYSSSDLFSSTNAFMRLKLPKSKNNSLFASDSEDDDDDSLFKSSKTPTTASLSETPSRGLGPLPKIGPALSSSQREKVKDPLMSMDDSE